MNGDDKFFGEKLFPSRRKGDLVQSAQSRCVDVFYDVARVEDLKRVHVQNASIRCDSVFHYFRMFTIMCEVYYVACIIGRQDENGATWRDFKHRAPYRRAILEYFSQTCFFVVRDRFYYQVAILPRKETFYLDFQDQGEFRGKFFNTSPLLLTYRTTLRVD